MIPIHQHQRISDRAVYQNHKPLTDRLEVTVGVRRRHDHAPLPSFDDYKRPKQRKRLSNDEFARLYGAHPDDIDAIKRHYIGMGLTHVESHDARKTITFSGTTSQINDVFNVQLAEYEKLHAKQFMRFVAPIGHPEIPDHLDHIITHVRGLDTEPRIHPMAVPASTSPVDPREVAFLYEYPAHLATGQNVGIFVGPGWGDVTAKDIIDTMNLYGFPVPNVTFMTINQGVVLGNEAETLLDVCSVATYGQGANIILYIGNSFTDVLSRVSLPNAGDLPIDIFSISGGTDEVLDMTTVLEDCAIQGITVLACTGDQGSTGYFGEDPNDPQAAIARVLYPASHPFCTAVGGTVIGNINGSNFDEWYWREEGPHNMGGGGISAIYPLPQYQANAVTFGSASADNPGFVGRGIPDISANASATSGIVLSQNNVLRSTGGTSYSTPLVAGLLARVNSVLGYNIGFINPTLYNIGSGNNIIHDIIPVQGNADNSNYLGANAPGYAVTQGLWDACTGLGVLHIVPFAEHYLALDAVANSVNNLRLTVNNLSTATMEFFWDLPSGDLSYFYQILISVNGGNFGFFADTVDQGYIVSHLTSGVQYSFRVIPVSGTKIGPASDLGPFQLGGGISPPSPSPSPTPSNPNESPNGTVVVDTSGSITDSQNNIWALFKTS